MTRDLKDEYSKEETAKRFRAALLGAKTAGHKPMESMTPKREKPQSKKRRRRSKKAA